MACEEDFIETRQGCPRCGFSRDMLIDEASPHRGIEDNRFVGWHWCPNCGRRFKRPVTVSEFNEAEYYDAQQQEQEG
jgi:predicted RNA-binding Zn-ribbon protein involved in translation (DUF1610 family)